MAAARSGSLLEQIEETIQTVRGCRVMLDADLAQLYGVTTANLLRTVRQSLGRFPASHLFQLTADEDKALRYQAGILKLTGRGGRRTLPFAFTEEGVAQLANTLGSARAVRVQREIARVFSRPMRTICNRSRIG